MDSKTSTIWTDACMKESRSQVNFWKTRGRFNIVDRLPPVKYVQRPPDLWDEEGIRDPTPRLPAVQNGELVAPYSQTPNASLRRTWSSPSVNSYHGRHEWCSSSRVYGNGQDPIPVPTFFNLNMRRMNSRREGGKFYSTPLCECKGGGPAFPMPSTGDGRTGPA
jgi:hypothetical protein